MCFSMLKAYCISDAEAGSSQGQDCDQPFYRQHITRPPFLGFPFGFLCNRRVTVPPQRTNRLPCMVAPKYIISSFRHQNKCLLLKKIDKCYESFFVVSDRKSNITINARKRIVSGHKKERVMGRTTSGGPRLCADRAEGEIRTLGFEVSPSYLKNPLRKNLRGFFK